MQKFIFDTKKMKKQINMYIHQKKNEKNFNNINDWTFKFKPKCATLIWNMGL